MTISKDIKKTAINENGKKVKEVPYTLDDYETAFDLEVTSSIQEPVKFQTIANIFVERFSKRHPTANELTLHNAEKRKYNIYEVLHLLFALEGIQQNVNFKKFLLENIALKKKFNKLLRFTSQYMTRIHILDRLITSLKYLSVDIIGKNKGFMDASTLYSVLAATYLYENFDFLKAVDPRIIYSGCVYPLTGLTKEQEDFISQSKAATGNTICDASLAMKKFDMKALPSPTNNYIVLWNYESFNLHGDVMKAQNALYNYLKKVPETDRTMFQQKLLALFNNLKDASLDTLQKQMILNEFVIKSLPIMKMTDRVSLIFPATNSSFEPNPVYDNTAKEIEIPIKRGSIDSSETKKAIMAIVDTWDTSKKNKFAEVTFNQKDDLD